LKQQFKQKQHVAACAEAAFRKILREISEDYDKFKLYALLEFYNISGTARNAYTQNTCTQGISLTAIRTEIARLANLLTEATTLSTTTTTLLGYDAGTHEFHELWFGDDKVDDFDSPIGLLHKS